MVQPPAARFSTAVVWPAGRLDEIGELVSLPITTPSPRSSESNPSAAIDRSAASLSSSSRACCSSNESPARTASLVLENRPEVHETHLQIPRSGPTVRQRGLTFDVAPRMQINQVYHEWPLLPIPKLASFTCCFRWIDRLRGRAEYWLSGGTGLANQLCTRGSRPGENRHRPKAKRRSNPRPSNSTPMESQRPVVATATRPAGSSSAAITPRARNAWTRIWPTCRQRSGRRRPNNSSINWTKRANTKPPRRRRRPQSCRRRKQRSSEMPPGLPRSSRS